MALPEISEAELRFVEEYCKDKNGTRAALAAGVSTTYQGARQAASKLLTKPDIKSWVRYLLGRQAKALKFRPSKVLRNWMLAATTDLTYFEVTADGRLTTAPGVPREYLRAVRKMKQTRTEFGGKVEVKTEIELRDPFGPETKLMEHYGELPPEPSGGGMTIEDAVRLRDALARRARLGGDLPGGVPVVPEGGAADGGVPQ
jgi:hypothetical protein